MMLIDFEPGDHVINPINKDWGIGQVQSIIGNRITVNFEHIGKTIILADKISLTPVADETNFAPNLL